MKLGIKERVLISKFLPTKGNLVSMTLRRDIEKKTALTQNEITTCGIKEKDGVLTWAEDAVIDVEFTTIELELLREGAARLDKEGEISFDMMDLYEMIVNA